MKHLPFLLTLLFMAVGCDAPMRTRNPQLYSNSYSGNSNGFTYNPGGTNGSNGGTTGSSSGTTTTAGFTNCNINENKFYNVDMGWFSICQSTLDESVFMFRTSLGSNTSPICLIPTYKDGGGSSTYLGDPQCTTTSANEVKTGKLYKTRPNFSGYPITGVMVLRQTLIAEYYNCMQAYINWPTNACNAGHSTCSLRSQCPYGGAGAVGTVCDNAARTFMNEVCSSFKSKYANAYTDVSTK